MLYVVLANKNCWNSIFGTVYVSKRVVAYVYMGALVVGGSAKAPVENIAKTNKMVKSSHEEGEWRIFLGGFASENVVMNGYNIVLSAKNVCVVICRRNEEKVGVFGMQKEKTKKQGKK